MDKIFNAEFWKYTIYIEQIQGVFHLIPYFSLELDLRKYAPIITVKCAMLNFQIHIGYSDIYSPDYTIIRNDWSEDSWN